MKKKKKNRIKERGEKTQHQGSLSTRVFPFVFQVGT